MARASIPPLLRGIGTTIVLLAGVISFLIARGQVQAGKAAHTPGQASVVGAKSDPQLTSLANEVELMRAEIQDDTMMEKVIENPWFEILGFLGTTVIASSFYSEWMIRKNENAPALTGIAPASPARKPVEESGKRFGP